MVERRPKQRKEEIIESVQPIITLEEVEKRLYDVWYEDTLNPDHQRRRDELIKLDSEMTPEIRELLEEMTTVMGQESYLTRGQIIQQKAVKEAEDYRRQEALKRRREAESNKSSGMRRHVRRVKSQERRGTNPRKIH